MALDDLPIDPPFDIDPPEEPPEIEYETRNILDTGAVVIGTLRYPVGTIEAIWTSTLALFSTVVINPIIALLFTTKITATGSVTTSSATASLISGMTSKPNAGTYNVVFTGSIFTQGASATGEFGMYVDGVLQQETRRDISCNLSLLGGLVTISLNTISLGTATSSELTLNGNQTVEVRFRSTNGGTIGISDRNLIFTRVK